MAQRSSYGCMHLVGETHLLFDRQSLYLFISLISGSMGLGVRCFVGGWGDEIAIGVVC
jgi:hypothetical protein